MAPNLTEVAPMNPVPVIVTVVEPAVGPAVGVKEVMVGTGATNLKLADEDPVPPAVVTEILTVPATCVLVTALIVVGPVTV